MYRVLTDNIHVQNNYSTLIMMNINSMLVLRTAQLTILVGYKATLWNSFDPQWQPTTMLLQDVHPT